MKAVHEAGAGIPEACPVRLTVGPVEAEHAVAGDPAQCLAPLVVRLPKLTVDLGRVTVRLPQRSATSPYSARRASTWSTAGRSGASPIPPATTTTSPPVGKGQVLPNGPRTPRTAPGRDAQIASVTAPTARTVCTSRSPRTSETEIGTSPIPKA